MNNEIKDVKSLQSKLIEEKNFSDSESEQIVKAVHKIVTNDIVLNTDNGMMEKFLTNIFSSIDQGEKNTVSQVIANAKKQFKDIQSSPEYKNIEQVRNSNSNNMLENNILENKTNNKIEDLFNNIEKLTEDQQRQVMGVIFGEKLGNTINRIMDMTRDGNTLSDEQKAEIGAKAGMPIEVIDAICRRVGNEAEKMKFLKNSGYAVLEIMKHKEEFETLSADERKKFFRNTFKGTDEEINDYITIFESDDMKEILKKETMDEITEKLEDIARKGNIIHESDEIQEQPKKEKRGIRGFFSNLKQKIFSGPKKSDLKEAEYAIEDPTKIEGFVKSLVEISSGKINPAILKQTMYEITSSIIEVYNQDNDKSLRINNSYYTENILSNIEKKIAQLDKKNPMIKYLKAFGNIDTIEKMLGHIENLTQSRIDKFGEEKVRNQFGKKGNIFLIDYLESINIQSMTKGELNDLIKRAKKELAESKQLGDSEGEKLENEQGEFLNILDLEALENGNVEIPGIDGKDENSEMQQPDKKSKEQVVQDSRNPENNRLENKEKAEKAEKVEKADKGEVKLSQMPKRLGFFAKIAKFFRNIKTEGIRGSFRSAFLEDKYEMLPAGEDEKSIKNLVEKAKVRDEQKSKEQSEQAAKDKKEQLSQELSETISEGQPEQTAEDKKDQSSPGQPEQTAEDKKDQSSPGQPEQTAEAENGKLEQQKQPEDSSKSTDESFVPNSTVVFNPDSINKGKIEAYKKTTQDQSIFEDYDILTGNINGKEFVLLQYKKSGPEAIVQKINVGGKTYNISDISGERNCIKDFNDGGGTLSLKSIPKEIDYISRKGSEKIAEKSKEDSGKENEPKEEGR